MTGTGSADPLGGQGAAEIRFAKLGAACSGTFRDYAPGKARGEIRCDDARVIKTESWAVSLSAGKGYGIDQFGHRGEFKFFTVLDQLSASPLNLAILDACRNNPCERRFRSVGGGLAQMEAPKGTLIAYATAPGKVAQDGDGANSTYTTALLKVLAEPGLAVESVFKRVRSEVSRMTNDAQIPWEASSLTGDFFFASAPTAPAAPAAVAAGRDAEAELLFWQSV